MKVVITAIISIVIGVISTYLYLKDEFHASNQLSNQFILMSELRYLELLEDGKHDALQQYLTMSVDCQASTIKQFIESGYWSENQITKDLIEKSKKYHNESNNCHEDIFLGD